jgi:hypothetical protein
MEKVKIYLDGERSGFVVCQECGKSKKVAFTNAEKPRSGTVKCSCGNQFSVLFESRKNYRKKVNIFGKCFLAQHMTDDALIQITNISKTGIGFIKLDGRPLKLDEKIRVSFPLGEGKIDSIASVHHFGKGGNIGANFINLDEHGRKILGFFLFP